MTEDMNQNEHAFRGISVLERLVVIWSKMSTSEKRIAAKFKKEEQLSQLETFVTVLERHNGSMEEPNISCSFLSEKRSTTK